MRTMLSKIKIVVVACVCVMLGVIFFVGDNGKVEANENVSLTMPTNTDEYAYAAYSSEQSEYVKKCFDDNAAPDVTDAKEQGYLFAGWYKEEQNSKVPVTTYDNTVETYYAKFIPEEVLGVKAQFSNQGKLRFVSSVDSLAYSRAGFILVKDGNEYSNDTKDVFKSIEAKEGTVEYNYSPKVVDADSEYFIAAIWPNVTVNDTFYVRSYFITLDGVEVVGPSRYLSAAHEDSCYINLAVKGLTTLENVTAELPNGITIENKEVLKEATVEDEYAHVLITLAGGTNKDLKSVTTFEFGNGVTAQYRNLFTTHKSTGSTVNADTSWYTEAEEGEKEFVIATSADFYGLASVVNGTDGMTAHNFSGEVVHVIADIEINAGHPYGADGEKDEADDQTPDDWDQVAPDYEWPVIGTSSLTFAGEFNGNNKTISGIYLNTTLAEGNYKGLFSITTASANIHNFALINSYFNTNGTTNGSIAGRVQGGIYNSIYSNAIVVGSNQNLGGLIGQHQNGTSDLTMKNCWFDGSVTNNYNHTKNASNTGGLIGAAFHNSTITSCLNTAAVTSQCNNSNPSVGGLVGGTKEERTVAISYCLNQGVVNYESAATEGYGRIVGYLPSKTSSLTDCYSTNPNPCSPISKGAATTLLTNTDKIEESAIKADVTKTKANKLLLYSENPWVAVAGSMPIPKTLEFVLGIK